MSLRQSLANILPKSSPAKEAAATKELADAIVEEAANAAASKLLLSRSSAINVLRSPTVSRGGGTASMEYARSKHATNFGTWTSDGFWLKITVKQILNMGAGDKLVMVPTLAPDPYVKLALVAHGEPVSEYCTRVVYRNKNPTFEEGCVFPLEGLALDESTVLVATVHDYDSLKDKLVGRLEWRLSMVLGGVQGVAVPRVETCMLVDKSGEVVPGELVLEITLLDPETGSKASLEKPPYTPPQLQSRYGGKSLELQLRRVHGLRAHLGAEEIGRWLKDLQFEIRVGQVALRVPVPASKLVVDSSRNKLSSVQLVMEDTVVVPLQEAFSLSQATLALGSLNRKPLHELGDVRVYLLAGSTQLCKAQVPLWELAGWQAAAQAVEDPKTPTAGIATDGGGGEKDKEAQEAQEAPSHWAIMERYSRVLSHPVHLEFAARLVSGSAGTASDAAAVVELGADDEEDVASAPPLPADQVPPPLSNPVVSETLPVGPCRLYQLLIDSRSALFKSICDQEGLTEVVVPDWAGAAPPSRNVTYVKPINVPFGPKSAKVQEAQKLLAKAPGGWVVDVRITTSAPKGDCFVVGVQMVAQRGEAPNTCTLRVTTVVDFVKSAGMLKGIIEKGASSDTAAHWDRVIAAVCGLGSATSSLPLPSMDSLGVSVAVPGKAPARPAGVLGALAQPTTAAAMLAALLVAFLLILVLLTSVNRSATRLRVEVAELRGQLELVAGLQNKALQAAADTAAAVARLTSTSTPTWSADPA